MLFGYIAKNLPTEIAFNTGAVDCVFKLFGIVITNNVSWENLVNAVCVKSSMHHLYFLKLLNCSSVTITITTIDLVRRLQIERRRIKMSRTIKTNRKGIV